MATETIDITPTWGNIGALYVRLAESQEVTAIRGMRADVARAFASAEALKAIMSTLNDEQRAITARTLTAELAKQGY
ncbi:hypothetical protein [Burkholderia gladioli]|uniref:hypothetical protein n=1 Tax=Burkholderia gladioli TaxID=28095 RepID=UPI001C5D8136|nr:hypothetical protein [Burkholderia gladioli]MBW5286543.1 hypothetical protein [Burkholderia gladioli]